MIDIYKERIKPLFDKSGLMNKELESEIGIPEKKISEWNAERLKSYDKYIPQIASYFRVSTDYLLGNTDDPSPAKQKEKPPAQGGEQDAEVQELIRLFDLATPELRAAALAVLRSAEAVQKARGDAGGKK